MLLNLLTTLYKAINDSCFLETRFGKSLFREAYFFYKKHFEDFYAPLLKQHPQLLSGGHVIDVGANIGYTTILFAQHLSPDFKVFAIEPHPANFEKLQENVSKYKLENRVVLIQAAVGETTGEIDLWENKTSHADHRILTPSLNDSLTEKSFKSLKVPMITIDSLSETHNLSGQVKFVKIDVQGYELPVLKGMKGLLQENPQLKVCLEYDPKMMQEMGFESDRIFDFFINYSRYLITRRGLRKISDNERISENQLNKGYADILFSKQSI
jgi:FkbM family methyltransferase